MRSRVSNTESELKPGAVLNTRYENTVDQFHEYLILRKLVEISTLVQS